MSPDPCDCPHNYRIYPPGFTFEDARRGHLTAAERANEDHAKVVANDAAARVRATKAEEKPGLFRRWLGCGRRETIAEAEARTAKELAEKAKKKTK